MNEKDVAVYEAPPEESVQLGTLMVAPEQVIKTGTRIANQLKSVIMSRKLFSKIGNKNYVRVEGWNTLGALMGILPKEEYVKEIENGYEASVELLRASDGVVIGGASAICTRDETNWKNRDDYAVRSMAITRATGKAFRLGFSWIMELAGYSPTPLEEMPPDVIVGKVKDVTPDPKPQKEGSDVLFGEAEKKAKTEKIQFPGWMIQGLTNAGLADNPFNANNLLNQFPELPKNTKKEEVNRLVEIYRVRRAKGTEKEIPVAEAAEVAWAEWNGS